MSESELTIERDGPLATVTFNRPAQRNALTVRMLEDLRHFFSQAVPAEPELRVVVLRGAGEKAFSSGSDFRDLRQLQDRGVLLSGPEDPFEQALLALLTCPLPVIALIRGFAVGGGCGLAVGCDIRIASDTARLGMPPAKLGLLYSQNELAPFIDLLGLGRTKLLFFGGRLYPADAALRFGLVDEVVPDGEIESYTYTLAREIAANAPLSVRNTKRVLTLLTRRRLDQAELSEIHELVRQTQSSDDFQEGQRAHLERRPPRFLGR